MPEEKVDEGPVYLYVHIHICIYMFLFNPNPFKSQLVRPKAMSASIGVDFTVQAGLLPQFLEICIGLLCGRIYISIYMYYGHHPPPPRTTQRFKTL